MVTRTLSIDQKTIFLYEQGTQGPVICWGMYPHQGNEVDHLIEWVKKLIPQASFTIAAFQVEDWNRDLSPWSAPPVFGQEAFAGEGKKTLFWLQNSFLPFLKEEYPQASFILAGYSLAGLFALWTAYETDIFSGVICCSGSLWYPTWDVYANAHCIQHSCDIYLSLGTKEEKTRNKVMASVGDRTRNQEILLSKDPAVQHVTLEWNPGGHFADSGERIAKGIQWILQQSRHYDNI